ncbi:Involved in peptidoglycan biosynthesis. Transports lipid-linked peptidoglycan precursors from the inner to the outer leaflet of the cytoplasmic membrane [Vibrio sp. B1FLJ16]|uniref:murein biosynthesis integral membrane protein MurJ n=1 Tax=Vibrio sp. B1FLJ16 TaxID=2751178 RepID=UPI0015F5663A|nr:murein biosynthesis integral membrane protein MurJ [Vibrio sp. B1FLJ16]CAD7799570.1 Involved in peptidoglycan biosynthesis. Transports lipid-linked peptidoglycan precursors from the inner to the outer leaflet of the cytoplasmic membrane [Vibrio sp. B1FLJ16]CAE6885484.1 Involved in peptidoglycan biosynthesis. Transports lipid-linked peptidoglycan precursors from the inner to the outer leaflet of the cytoplasmic membrane [Vibrio sp. B1FLJ16]
MSKRLLKSGMIVSAMTLISRVLGLVRDVVVANLMGAGASADVFFFANKIPNFLRRLFAEGAFSQAFVPVLTERHAQGDMDKTRELIARAAGTLGVIVSVVTLLGVLGSGVVTALFGFGWFLDWMNGGPSAEKFELASMMLKITFPYLWFITFVALSGAILNTLGKFAVSSFTPVFLNVMIILSAWLISPQMSQPEIGLAIGVFLGGLVQFLFQIPFLIKAGVMVKPKWGWRDPGVVKIRTLMIPALFGVSVSQINLLFDTFIASFLQTGSISWLYYSDRLLEFPLGLFGIAIATVILPALSRKHVDAHSEGFAHTMDWGVRMVTLLGIPAMLGLMVLAKPMLMVLFMRGEFSPQDVHQASLSLFAYASGLLNFMLIKVLAPGYYSRQDTKTPVKYGIIAMATNMVFNAIFAYFYGYVGLAIATALSAFVNMVLLYRGLHLAGVYQVSKRTVFFITRLAIAGAAMVAVILWKLEDMSVWLDWSFAYRSGMLGMLIAMGAAVYLVVLFLTGVRLKDLKAGTE